VLTALAREGLRLRSAGSLTAFAARPRHTMVARTIVNLGPCPPLSMRRAVDDGRRNKRGDRDRNPPASSSSPKMVEGLACG